jgi:hypothetical protein
MACYIIRSAKTYISTSSLKTIYYAHFHSLMNYGIIFWGNSALGATIFWLQKKTMRITEGCGNRVSCRDLFRQFHILPLTFQYLLSLLMFVVQHKDHLQAWTVITLKLGKVVICIFHRQTCQFIKKEPIILG